MRAGQLDRRIVIQAFTATTNGHNEPVKSWAKVHGSDTLAAAFLPMKGGERYAASQVLGTRTATFRIRYRSDVNQLCRIQYGGEVWEILDVRELGRREGLELDARTGANNG